ncbi:retrotransposon-related protein [Tanacetum coccineum]
MKWLLKLMGFDYEILYKKGSENCAADALSRVPTISQLMQMVLTTATTDLLPKIVNSWKNDTVLQAIITRLQKGENVKHYTWNHDQLRRKGKLVIGNDTMLRQALLVHFHNDSVGGHSGNTTTVNRHSGMCYWKKMRHDVKTFVASCTVCQRSKYDLAAYLGLLQPLPVPNLIWKEISMDFIEGLPMSNGKSVILVVVDRLSKYNHFIAPSHPFTAVQVANAFMDHVYKLHGEKLKEWSKWLSLAEYWYNNFHTAIQTTPYEVVYGQPPPNPITYVQGQSIVDQVDRSLSAREAMVQMLKFHLQRAQQKMKVQADKKRTDRVFEVNQWVYLKLLPHRQVTIRQGKYNKLTPKYYGPFQIISKLKLYKGPLPNAMATLPVCDPQGEVLKYHVKVLDRRLGKVGNSAAVYVLIQWSNSPEEDATWELHSDMMKRFPDFPINS